MSRLQLIPEQAYMEIFRDIVDEYLSEVTEAFGPDSIKLQTFELYDYLTGNDNINNKAPDKGADIDANKDQKKSGLKNKNPLRAIYVLKRVLQPDIRYSYLNELIEEILINKRTKSRDVSADDGNKSSEELSCRDSAIEDFDFGEFRKIIIKRIGNQKNDLNLTDEERQFFYRYLLSFEPKLSPQKVWLDSGYMAGTKGYYYTRALIGSLVGE